MPGENGDSNTSHVLIYQISTCTRRTGLLIQIHLMFLFIPSSDCMLPGKVYSNTSHVLIYQYRYAASGGHLYIQIHLMFLFILKAGDFMLSLVTFKYISCSYLSPYGHDTLLVNPLFKYISCSYLSNTS